MNNKDDWLHGWFYSGDFFLTVGLAAFVLALLAEGGLGGETVKTVVNVVMFALLFVRCLYALIHWRDLSRSKD
jgi:hypothetical protein